MTKVVVLSDSDATLVASLLEDFLENAREAAYTDNGVDPEMDADNNRIQGIADAIKPETDPITIERDTRFWNVQEVLNKWIDHRSYRDFEGFANPGVPARLVKEALEVAGLADTLMSTLYVDGQEVDGTELNTFIRDALLHYCYETVDQAGEEFLPTATELRVTAQILQVLFNGPLRWMKVSKEDFEAALTATAESEEEGGE